MKKKRIFCRGHSVFFVYPQDEAKTGWADVWITYHGGKKPNEPGRREHRYGLTLISKSSVEWDLEAWKQPYREEPAVEGLVAKEDKEDYNSCMQEAIEEELHRLRMLEKDEFWFENENNGCPSIYTRTPFINRREATRMIETFMARKGFHHVALDWKVPKIIVGELG